MKSIPTLLLLTLCIGFIQCNSSASEEQTAVTAAAPVNEHSQAYRNVDPAAFSELINTTANVQLIDVRTQEEYSQGHLAGAQNLNFNGADFNTQISGLDKNNPVLVYCAVGGRSSKAARLLQDMGFQRVYNLVGGIKAWDSSGKEIVKN